MKRFLFFNCVGQTGGSYLMDCLQHAGIACIDEYFNPRVFRPGKYTERIFGENVCREPTDKTSLYKAFEHIASIAPEKAEWIGVKVCSSQRHSITDFNEALNDPDIYKILHYRHSITYYLTKYFHYSWRKMRATQKPDFRMNPDPFFHYAAYKAEGMKNYLDVESEDLFDFRTNSLDHLADLLSIDAYAMKIHAANEVQPASMKTIKQLGEEASFTEEDWAEMLMRFELVPYSFDKSDKVRDCRSINQNLGFL